MKELLFLSICFISSFSFAQDKDCSCNQNSEYNSYIKCETTFLHDKGFLNYHFNCDSIWLILNENEHSYQIFSMGTDLIEYTYRIGYQLIREFDNSLLFRYDCPATGSCNHILINKKSGKVIQKFHELVYKGNNSNAPFIIYFSNDYLDSLTIDFLDLNKSYKIMVDSSHFKSTNPEFQFDEGYVNQNKFILSYDYYNSDSIWTKSKIILDLNKYGR